MGWEIHTSDSAEHAVQLLKRTALAEGIAGATSKPVLHGDNGATLKATTVLAMLHWLGIAPSYSRPRVSNDNAYAESVFRTAKYRPQFPAQGVADVQQALMKAWRLPELLVRHHLASGALVNVAPRRVLPVQLYWHCWNLASDVLENLSKALRDAAAATLHP